MRTARFLFLLLVLALAASAGLVEFVVDFDSHGETRTMYVSGENLEFTLTSCTTLCGFNFTTPQASQKVWVEFANDFDPHNAYYWQDPSAPYQWHLITSGPYLDNPVSFNPSKLFSIVTSSNAGFYDTAMDPGHYRLSRVEYPDSGARPDLTPDPTPEPATFALMGGGIFAIAIWRRRRQTFL